MGFYDRAPVQAIAPAFGGQSNQPVPLIVAGGLLVSETVCANGGFTPIFTGVLGQVYALHLWSTTAAAITLNTLNLLTQGANIAQATNEQPGGLLGGQLVTNLEVFNQTGGPVTVTVTYDLVAPNFTT